MRVVVLILVSGCGGEPDSDRDTKTAVCDGVLQEDEGDVIDSTFDKDGDGYLDAADPNCQANYGQNRLDCDDSDDQMHPDHSEVECNGLDDDCNSDTEDARDEDFDGSPSCEDCDDLEPGRFPGNEERCWDDLDNDCDQVVDPGCGPNYNGTFDLTPAVDLECRLFGIPFVSIAFSEIQTFWVPPNATMTTVGSAQPGSLSGPIEDDGAFVLEGQTVIGTFASCDEYYRMTGTFTDADHFTMTFQAYYTGTCGQCGGYFEFPDIQGVRTADATGG